MFLSTIFKYFLVEKANRFNTNPVLQDILRQFLNITFFYYFFLKNTSNIRFSLCTNRSWKSPWSFTLKVLYTYFVFSLSDWVVFFTIRFVQTFQMLGKKVLILNFSHLLKHFQVFTPVRSIRKNYWILHHKI